MKRIQLQLASSFPLRQQGFTLIEVLIALAIIAIALTAILKASSSYIEDTMYIKNKNIAAILANNVLTKAQLGLIQAEANHSANLLNMTLYWTLIEIPTPDSHVDKLTVIITTAPNQIPLLQVWGFKYV